MTKTCIRCKKMFEFNNNDEKNLYFYKKGLYYQNICKECEKQEHKDKYKNGKYDYRRKNLEKYKQNEYPINMNAT